MDAELHQIPCPVGVALLPSSEALRCPVSTLHVPSRPPTPSLMVPPPTKGSVPSQMSLCPG